MKNIAAILATTLITCGVYAQKIKETAVPKAVVESFHKNFGDIKVEKWEKEKGKYEAEFDQKKDEVSALFTEDGTLLETEKEIKFDELPAAVAPFIKKTYPAYKLNEASKITAADNQITYEAEVKKGKEEMDLLFDANGNFIKREGEVEDYGND
jgi:hypothetical protein